MSVSAFQCCAMICSDECCPSAPRPVAGGLTILVGLLLSALGAVLVWYSLSSGLHQFEPLRYITIVPIGLGIIIMIAGGRICCNTHP